MALLQINEGLNKITTLWNRPAAARARSIARSVGSDLRGNLTSGGGITQMAAGGLVGGGAGYAYGGDMESTAKGAGLGVLGIAGYRGSGVVRGNSGLRSAVSDVKAWGVSGMRRQYQQQMARELATANKGVPFSRLADRRPGVRINGMSMFPKAPF